ncbi:MAG: deoxyribonuclease IV [Candidatus Babeliaceae bacterium]
MEKQLLLGAHMSIAGGLQNALLAGESIGCTAIQIFTHSNRQWHLNPLAQEEIDLFKTTWKKTNIQSVQVHASYLLNIGSSQAAMRTKSVHILEEELVRCQKLEIPYLILHPGSSLKDSPQDCLKHITESITSIFEKTPGKTKILLENMAGQGTSIGYTFEQLATLIELIKPKSRIGICFDTCHAFASGYDFTTPEKYAAMWKQFDDIIGLKYLHAFHLNDSKKELGSRVDRHEDIGKGKLGIETFKLIINDKRFFDIPKVLETPYHILKDYLHNMDILKELLTPSNRTLLHIKK